MRFFRLGGILLSAVILSGGLGSATAQAKDDWNLWQEAVFPVYSKDRYGLSLIEHIRFRDDFSEIFFTQIKIKNSYKVTDWLTGSLSYSYIQLKGSDKHWDEENRPDLELLAKWSQGDWALDSRNRFELRLFEGSTYEEEVRIRLRQQVTYTIPKFDRKWQVFASNEAFYDVAPDSWNQNRVFAGLRWKVNDNFSTYLAWGIQSLERGSDWEDRQLLYSNVKIKF